MFSVYRLSFVLALGGTAHAAALWVCADPNNLPYSNIRQQGFENELARLIAGDLGMAIGYEWVPQRGNYLQNTLQAGKCDMVMGIAQGVEEVDTTHPYYRSTYVFVSRHGRRPAVPSFDDERLRKARIGVHVLQSENATSPPVQMLISRGLAANIEWFRLYPDFTRANPPADLIEAVARGEIDVAVAWGPTAGFFAKSSPVPLDVLPVPNQWERSIPLAFDISIGVRQGDDRLREKLNGALGRQREAIRRMLERYGVPLVDGTGMQIALQR